MVNSLLAILGYYATYNLLLRSYQHYHQTYVLDLEPDCSTIRQYYS